MTLNNIISRLRTIALAHKQIRRFRTGLAGDLFADKTAKYPACCLQYDVGRITVSGHAVVVNFRLIVLDLVNVVNNTKINEDDVLSDTLSIMLDLTAQINSGNYPDWFLSTDNQINALVEYENDMDAGWYMDFSIRTPFTQDICQIPSVLVIDPNPEDMADKLVYDVKYISNGSEGNTLTSGGATPMIPEINGKKVLFITRESSPIYKTSSAPASDEYVWNNTNITLGTAVNPAGGEKFLILYRNY